MKNLNIKVKTALLGIATLLIGLLLGALIYRSLSQARIKKIMDFRTHEGFVRRFEGGIIPGITQRDTVRKIIKKYAWKFQQINQEQREKITLMFKEFHEELSKVLTPEQMKHFRRRFFRQRRLNRRRPRFRKGPPPVDKPHGD
jgi:hypothetical protein